MPTRPYAILEHTLPDGGVHHDLLIDRPDAPDPLPPIHDDDARTLWAVRIDPAPRDWGTHDRLVLTPLPPHRRLYLHYEGPISNNRGTVRRLAQGRCEINNHPDRKTIRLTLAGQPLTLTVFPDAQAGLLADVQVNPAT